MSPWNPFSSNKGKSPTSADVARARLQFVLVHDRNEISPGVLQQIKDDIIAVISQHIRIDRRNVEVHFMHEASEGKLIVDIPLLREDFVASRPQGRTRSSNA
jgi:cell division topological specificity factor